MKSTLLRQLFLKYFEENGHKIVPSASLIPTDDPSLLFTNAGMVPFKEVFLGLKKPVSPRVVSCQRCLRAGGKHNDLENVGYTARHHTFFEMLGNFSFGNYFKREAIQYSWKFLTEKLNLPAEKLWVTVFTEDDEAADIWLKEIQIDPKRFSRCGPEENFWSMGDTGPCGPCSEIFYDHGPHVLGGPPGTPTADGDRYIEIWNLVFMQYQRNATGDLSLLPKPSIDTGMGIERLTAVMQGVTNNYETDLFLPLIKEAAKISGIKDFTNTSLRVIADHIRACAFLILDGVLPGNEGRSYVLRRIMRRAIRHGHKLGLDKPFFYKLVKPLVKNMQKAYPELIQKQAFIEQVILQEEEQFSRTLTHGMQLLEQSLAEIKGKQLPGDVVFRLYDTYGFPVDLTADVARERDVVIDMQAFEAEMQRQRNQSKSASQFSKGNLTVKTTQATDFLGYQSLSLNDVPIIEIFKSDQQPVSELKAGEEGFIILYKTPFYAESGGQVGDQGQLIGPNGMFLVTNTLKQGDIILHQGKMTQGTLKSQEKLAIKINEVRRHAITLNHSATHLLHAALKQILGQHILQKGSLVEAERLRFDFSHPKPLSAETLREVEDLVNQKIRANYLIKTDVMPIEKAKQEGAVAIFGEKYNDMVRVLTMGDFSKELCGGTHVKRTGDIGLFKIISELGISSGVRRIQAITGQIALDWVASLEKENEQLAALFKTSRDKLLEKAKAEITTKQSLQKQIEELQRSVAGMMADEIIAQATELSDEVQLLISEINGVDVAGLRYLLDQLKGKLDKAVIILASKDSTGAKCLIGVTKSMTNQIKANELAQHLAHEIEGKGGGRFDFAQVGAGRPEALASALKKARNWVEAHLNGNYA